MCGDRERLPGGLTCAVDLSVCVPIYLSIYLPAGAQHVCAPPMSLCMYVWHLVCVQFFWHPGSSCVGALALTTFHLPPFS